MTDTDIFSRLGLKPPEKTAPSPQSAPEGGDLSVFDRLGFKPPDNTSPEARAQQQLTAQQQAERDAIPKPMTDAQIAASPKFTTPLEKAGGVIRDIFGSVGDEAVAGGRMTMGGVANALQGQSARGAGEAGMGLLQTLTSPLAAVKHVATRVTGDKGFGEKAALIPPGALITPLAAKVAPATNALNTMVNDIAKGGPQAVSDAIVRLKSNPKLAPMDVAPGVETRAMGIATGAPSTGQTTLFDAARRRSGDAPGDVRAAYTDAMGGPAPDVVVMLDTLKRKVSDIGKSQIEPALAATGPVNVTSVINKIDEQLGPRLLRELREGKTPSIEPTPIQKRLIQVREELTYRGPDSQLFPKKTEYFLDPTAKPGANVADGGAHGVQVRLRREAEELTRSADGDKRLLGSSLGDVRGRLVEAIDRAGGGKPDAPGAYRQGLTAYREAHDVDRAREMGQSIFSTSHAGKNASDNRPEVFAEWVKNATKEEIEAARIGGRIAIDNHIGFARNAARTGEGVEKPEFVREKLKLLYGEEGAGRLMARLQDTADQARVNANLTANSKTARSRAAQEETKEREVKTVLQNAGDIGQRFGLPVALDVAQAASGSGVPGILTAGLVLAGVGKKGAQVIGRAADRSFNKNYAEIASDSSPKMRNALISALEAKAAELSGGQKLTNALVSSARFLPSP